MPFLRYYKIIFVLLPLFTFFSLGLLLDKELESSVFENRMLVRAPALLWKNRNQWENYLSDHLLGRNFFLKIYFKLMGNSENLANGIILTKEIFVFSFKQIPRNLSPLKLYQNKSLFSAEKEQQILDSLQRIQAWCKEHHIQLYFIIPPDKSMVYEHLVPSYILRQNQPNAVAHLVQQIPQEIKYIPILDMLKSNTFNQEPVYFLTDSHWTETAGWLVYQELINVMRKDFPDIKPIEEGKDFKKIKIAEVANLCSTQAPIVFDQGNLIFPGIKYPQEPIYSHYIFLKQFSFNWKNQFQNSYYADGNEHNVYIIGDSFSSYLHRFFAATFRHVEAFRFNEPNKEDWGIHFLERQKKMLENKTDILILSVSDLKLLDLAEAFK